MFNPTGPARFQIAALDTLMASGQPLNPAENTVQVIIISPVPGTAEDRADTPKVGQIAQRFERAFTVPARRNFPSAIRYDRAQERYPLPVLNERLRKIIDPTQEELQYYKDHPEDAPTSGQRNTAWNEYMRMSPLGRVVVQYDPEHVCNDDGTKMFAEARMYADDKMSPTLSLAAEVAICLGSGLGSGRAPMIPKANASTQRLESLSFPSATSRRRDRHHLNISKWIRTALLLSVCLSQLGQLL